MFLFTSDICGELARLPRHARAWGDLAALQQAIREERVKALAGFRADIASGAFPSEQQIAAISPAELEAFRQRLPP